jgi:hypothetical protein
MHAASRMIFARHFTTYILKKPGQRIHESHVYVSRCTPHIINKPWQLQQTVNLKHAITYYAMFRAKKLVEKYTTLCALRTVVV